MQYEKRKEIGEHKVIMCATNIPKLSMQEIKLYTILDFCKMI